MIEYLQLVVSIFTSRSLNKIINIEFIYLISYDKTIMK